MTISRLAGGAIMASASSFAKGPASASLTASASIRPLFRPFIFQLPATRGLGFAAVAVMVIS